MKGWAKTTIDLTTGDGCPIRDALAYVRHPFAIVTEHPEKSHGHSLTHTPSGRRICFVPTLALGRRIATRLRRSRVVDWTSPKPFDGIRQKHRTRWGQRAMALIASMGGVRLT